VAYSEGDQNDAEDVPEDHEGGDGQGESTECAYHDPHPYPRRLQATEPGATRFQHGTVAPDGTTQGDYGSGPTCGVLG
jgi:hypothetical protein